MRRNTRYCLDGVTKAICRCGVVKTSGFNNRQTKGFAGKNFDRKYAEATLALLAKCKGDRAFPVQGHTVRIKQDTVALDQPGRQPQGLT